jgi:hypothetical protein
MDPIAINLASGVMGVLVPLVKRGEQEFISSAGKDAYEKSKVVLETLEQKWSEDREAAEILEFFEHRPDRYKSAVEDILKEKLAGDKALVQELQTILNDVGSCSVVMHPEAINVHDPPFNAVGDGVTDDSSAIQEALDSLAGVGGEVLVPPGTYYLATPLILDQAKHQAITLSGIGWGRSVSPPSSVVFKCASSGIMLNAELPNVLKLNRVLYGFELRNIFFLGVGNHDHLLKLNGLYSAKLINVATCGSAVGKDGLQLANFANIQIDNYSVCGMGRYGVNLNVEGAPCNSSTTLHWKCGYVKNCNMAGLYAVGANQMTDITIDGVLFEACGRNDVLAPIHGTWGIGAIFDNCENVTVNAYFEANVLADVVIGGTVACIGAWKWGRDSYVEGVGCRSVVIRGAFNGQSDSLDPVIEGVKIIKCDGIHISGFFSGYRDSHIALFEHTLPTIENYRIRGIEFGPCATTSIPNCFVRDRANRVDPARNPSGLRFNGLWPDYQSSYVCAGIPNAGYCLPSFFRTYIITSFKSDSSAEIELPKNHFSGYHITLVNATAFPMRCSYMTKSSPNAIIAPRTSQDFIFDESGAGYVPMSAVASMVDLQAIPYSGSPHTATLSNGPAHGDPVEWVSIKVNGVTRWIPTW